MQILFARGLFIYTVIWTFGRLSTVNDFEIKTWIFVLWKICFVFGFSSTCVIGEELVLWFYFVSLVTFCVVLIWDPPYELGDERITLSSMQIFGLWVTLLALSWIKISAGVVKLLLLWIFGSLVLLSVLILLLRALEIVTFLLTFLSSGFLINLEF